LALAAALVTLGLLAAVGGWYFGIGRYTETPSLLDKTGKTAEAEARQFGFKVSYGQARYDEKKAKDLVLEQQPPAGARIVSGGTITLILSLGPERITIPDESGKNIELVLKELRELKLVPERSDAYDDVIPKDSVLRTDPPAGGVVGPNTKITVFVSKGRAPITVPNVIGQNVDQAQATLKGLKLQVTVTEKDSDKPKGEVIGQDPAEGASAEPGQKITITISKGPPEADIPDVRGQNAQQAKAALEGLGFQVTVFGNPNGTVVAQNPGGGRAPRGTQINLLAA
jgi:serine/threonine-protein kinase